MEEVKPPEHLMVHFKKEGRWFEKKYLRYHQPNKTVKDYAMPNGESPCQCGYKDGDSPKEPASAPTEGGGE